MSTITMKTPSGADAGTVDLDGGMFGIEPNVPVMHQVVTAQLAARRAGTQSTKTRSEVRGGGAKPWSQKGTGRARAGSSRSPIWRGGGVALGPKPRSYAQRTPKKMVRLALRSALSDRAAEGKVIVVDSWSFEVPRTKEAIAALAAVGAEGRVLLVAKQDDRTTWLSFRNVPRVHVISPTELNAYDVLCSDVVVFSQDTLPAHVESPTRAHRDANTPSPEAEGPTSMAQREAKARASEAAGLVAQAKKARAEAAAPETPTPPSAALPNPSADPTEGEDDMDPELPNREKPTDFTRTVIDPKDRVKSVADKADPRFEAARQKAEKEELVRSQRGPAEPIEDTDDVVEDDGANEANKSSGPFSFNVPKPEDEA